MRKMNMRGVLLGGMACLSLAAGAQESGVPDLTGFIITPAAQAAPRFNGGSVFGVRPGSPIQYTLAVAGQRPMTLSAEGLPEGATFDAEKGLVRGAVKTPGTYTVKLSARNAAGQASRELKLVVGGTFALTPPDRKSGV